jgi:DNA-binding HxlR family transcriptional regulator
MSIQQTEGPDCADASPLAAEAITTTLSVLGGKWKLLILWHLHGRTVRFNELKRAIAGVTQHMLTVQLRDLEHDGLIKRTIYAEIPPRVEYTLTPYASSLEPVWRAMATWGAAHTRRRVS